MERTRSNYSLLYIVLVVMAAIISGRLAGNYLYQFSDLGLKQIDPGFFKQVLEYRLPLIYTTYNSGSTRLSWNYELNGISSFLFDFELTNPLTIINSLSSQIQSYYAASYLQEKSSENGRVVAGNETGTGAGTGTGTGTGTGIGMGAGTGTVTTEQDNSGTGETGNKIAVTPYETYKGPVATGETDSQQKPVLLEDASSIAYEADVNDQASAGNTISSGNVIIQNETQFQLNSSDIDRLLSEKLVLNLNRKGQQVLIYHTHTTEGYLKNTGELTSSKVSSWTMDPRYSVVRVGAELMKLLRDKYGISILHNATVHDSPDYRLSYQNSLKTVMEYQKSYPSLGVFLDIHRDALGGGEKLRKVVAINGKQAAQLMFVIGTNGTGLEHPYWMQNLKLAVKLHQTLEEKYPGLMRPIILSKNRYNQHLSVGSIIIEVGGDGNTVAECLESMKYLSWAINEIIFKK